MAAYVAMLRGINVAGRNRIAMNDLRQLVTGLGHSNVATYIQSGNVVFTSTRRGEVALVAELERELTATFGLEIAVLLRSRAELGKVLEGSPFRAADQGELHVTFLTGKPEPKRSSAVEAYDAGPDEARVAGRDVYLHCAGGYGRTKLNNAFLERRLGLVATTRNWKTVNTLYELAGGAVRP